MAKKHTMTGFTPRGGGFTSILSGFQKFFETKQELTTHCKRVTHVDISNDNRKCAFTLAEVLITLGIIGIVAAMTLPSLIANHRRQAALVKIKQTYNILNNALELAKVDYDTDVNNWFIPTEGSMQEKSTYFFEHYMKPYLNITTVCGTTTKYCQYDYKYLNGNGAGTFGKISSTTGVTFVLNNGTFVYLLVGKGYTTEGDDVSRVRITFDIDGPKGFNKKGYDVFNIELGGKEGSAKKNNANRNKFLPYLYNPSKSCDYYVTPHGGSDHSCTLGAVYGGGECLATILCNGWDYGNKYPW